MPLEIESPVKTAVNARPHVNQVRRGRSENQLSTESEFYDQLLRFQTPEVSCPVATAPEPTPESSFDSNAGPDAADGESEETRDSESSEASQAESQAPAPTVVAPHAERALEQDPTAKAQSKRKNDQEVESAEAADDQDSPYGRNEDLAVNAQEDANARRNVVRNTNKTQSDAPLRKKTEVAASSNEVHGNSKREVKSQEAKHAEAPHPAESSPALKAENHADRNTNSQPTNLVESSAKRTPTAENKPHTNEANRAAQVSSRVADKKRTTTEHDTLTKSNTTSSSQSVQAPGPAREIVKQEKTNARRSEPAVENPSPQASESSRGRRRTDRNASRRAGGNNEGPTEAADRPIGPDKTVNSRGESTSVMTSREIAASQQTDAGNLGSTSISAINPSASSVSPTPAPTPAATPAFFAGSPAPSSSDTRSGKGVSRTDSNLQGTTAVASSSASTPESSNSRSPSPTTGSSGPRLTQYQETKLVQRVLRGMEQLSNGGGQVRLRLHPPELGSLQMSLRIEGNTVFAEMKVETTSARDALVKNLPVLKERLAEQGIQVEHFDVRTDGGLDNGSGGGNFSTSSQNSQNGNDSYSGRQTSRYVSELQNRLPSQEVGGGSETSRRWTRTLGQLDFEA